MRVQRGSTPSLNLLSLSTTELTFGFLLRGQSCCLSQKGWECNVMGKKKVVVASQWDWLVTTTSRNYFCNRPLEVSSGWMLGSLGEKGQQHVKSILPQESPISFPSPHPIAESLQLRNLPGSQPSSSHGKPGSYHPKCPSHLP